MEHRNKTWFDFVRDHLAAVSAAAGGLILAVMVLLFTPGLYAVGWHYAACYFLVIACWLCSRAGKTRLALALVGLTCVVAVAGFFLVYAGPFAQSGKTMEMYIGRYGLISLPIFLFPCAAFLASAWSGKS